MKRFLVSLICLCAMAANAVHVTWNYADFTSASQGVKRIYITPLSTPNVTGGLIIVQDRKLYNSTTNSSLTVSNMTAGSYRVEFQGIYTSTFITNTFPSTNILVDAVNYITTGTNTTGNTGVAYSAAASDSRFQRASLNLTNLSATGAITNIVAGSNVTVQISGKTVTVNSIPGAGGSQTNDLTKQQASATLTNLAATGAITNLVSITNTVAAIGHKTNNAVFNGGTARLVSAISTNSITIRGAYPFVLFESATYTNFIQAAGGAIELYGDLNQPVATVRIFPDRLEVLTNLTAPHLQLGTYAVQYDNSPESDVYRAGDDNVNLHNSTNFVGMNLTDFRAEEMSRSIVGWAQHARFTGDNNAGNSIPYLKTNFNGVFYKPTTNLFENFHHNNAPWMAGVEAYNVIGNNGGWWSSVRMQDVGNQGRGSSANIGNSLPFIYDYGLTNIQGSAFLSIWNTDSDDQFGSTNDYMANIKDSAALINYNSTIENAEFVAFATADNSSFIGDSITSGDYRDGNYMSWFGVSRFCLFTNNNYSVAEVSSETDFSFNKTCFVGALMPRYESETDLVNGIANVIKSNKFCAILTGTEMTGDYSFTNKSCSLAWGSVAQQDMSIFSGQARFDPDGSGGFKATQIGEGFGTSANPTFNFGWSSNGIYGSGSGLSNLVVFGLATNSYSGITNALTFAPATNTAAGIKAALTYNPATNSFGGITNALSYLPATNTANLQSVSAGTFSADTTDTAYNLGQFVTNTGTSYRNYFINFAHSGNLATRSVDCQLRCNSKTNILHWNGAASVLTAAGTNFFVLRVPVSGYWCLTNVNNVTALTYDSMSE